MYTLIGGDGKEYGPATTEAVREWLAAGRCDARTLARRAGDPQWKPLGDHPEFASTLGKPVPPAGDGWAMASLICGLAGFVIYLAAPVGVVLGLTARLRGNRSAGWRGRSGLAIAGIVVSSCMTILPLAGLLPRALAQAKRRAESTRCRGNLEQLSAAVLAYTKEDREGRFPPVASWCDAISNRLASPKIFCCPRRAEEEGSYAINRRLEGRVWGQLNSKTVLLFESDAGWNGAGGEEQMVTRRHSTPRVNLQGTSGREAVYFVTFVDGSFAALPESGLVVLRWEP
jgi:hypothetical protein